MADRLEGVLLGSFAAWVATTLALRSESWRVVNARIGSTLVLGAAALCALRASRREPEQRCWYAFALAAVLWAAGDLYFGTVVPSDASMPAPCPCDALWIASYLALYVGIVLRVRSRASRFPASMWLDGLIGALAMASLAVAIASRPLLEVAGTTPVEVMVNVSYPLADLVLLALLVASLPLLNWEIDRAWWLVMAAMVVLALADTTYLWKSTANSYALGSWLDLLWPLSFLLVGRASGQGRQPRRRSTVLRQPVALPAGGAVLVLGVLVAGGFRSLNPVALLLAGATVVVVLARMGLAFGELRTLAQTRVEARTDELTGCGNRRRFGEELAARTSAGSAAFALLVLDLDGFKDINDSLGHSVGDAVLRLLGPRLADALGDGDSLCRLGGDEFGVLLGGPVDRPRARRVAATLLACFADPFEVGGATLRASASAGIAMFPDDAVDPDELFAKADAAMYDAKRLATGIATYDRTRYEQGLERLRTMDLLRRAIEQGDLVLMFQPKVDLRSQAVLGFEALVRWPHPDRGVLTPDLFMDLAEQSHLARRITALVLEEALTECARWQLAWRRPIPVSVNVSVADLLDDSLVGDIRVSLGRHGLHPGLLTVEVTEGMVMTQPAKAAQVLTELRDLGVRSSIDDYGAGYSSLSHLRDLPVDELKLDRHLLVGFPEDERASSIIASTIGLATALGLTFVAEGVERPEEAAALCRLGCGLGQGFLLGPPMRAEDLETWMAARESRADPTESTMTTTPPTGRARAGAGGRGQPLP